MSQLKSANRTRDMLAGLNLGDTVLVYNSGMIPYCKSMLCNLGRRPFDYKFMIFNHERDMYKLYGSNPKRLHVDHAVWERIDNLSRIRLREFIER